MFPAVPEVMTPNTQSLKVVQRGGHWLVGLSVCVKILVEKTTAAVFMDCNTLDQHQVVVFLTNLLSVSVCSPQKCESFDSVQENTAVNL